MSSIRKGASVQFNNTTGGDLAKGAVVVLGSIIGVTAMAIAQDETGTVCIEGVFEVPKVPAAVFAQGEKLIFDSSAGEFDDSSATPASGDVTGAAVAMVAGAASETTCQVLLTPGNTAVA